MKKLLITAFISLGMATAHAAGDAAAGQAKAAVCGACHGADGNSMVPNFPKLAGQNERYLVKQMQDIQCGGLSEAEQKQRKCAPRTVVEMTGQLDRMSDQDLADIAAYFAGQKASVGEAKPELAAKGAALYRGGASEKGLAACSACHSPTGHGNAMAGFPALSGQHAGYVATQLKAFRAAADGLPGRSNDGESKMMRDVAARLSDSEIEAVASYIAGLH